MTKKLIKSIILLSILGLSIYLSYRVKNKYYHGHKTGDKIDSLNGVYVYYNGDVGNIEERNLTADGYNLGLKYQCVEFVKRYYYEHYHHKMPDTFGNAKDFFDEKIQDGHLNLKRNLLQFTNPGSNCPNTGDLLIFAGNTVNPYGHVAIVSDVREDEIEIIQQNPGALAATRITIGLIKKEHTVKIDNERILGWLRMKNSL